MGQTLQVWPPELGFDWRGRLCAYQTLTQIDSSKWVYLLGRLKLGRTLFYQPSREFVPVRSVNTSLIFTNSFPPIHVSAYLTDNRVRCKECEKLANQPGTPREIDENYNSVEHLLQT